MVKTKSQVLQVHPQKNKGRGESESGKRLKKKLKRELGPTILEALSLPDVEDITRNSDGNLWVKRRGQRWEILGQLNDIQTENILRAVASSLGVEITPDRPYLDGELITEDGSRIHGNIPPESSRPCFTIRKKPEIIYSLEHYLETSCLSEHFYEVLCHDITSHRNIIVVGGTASGKTTFVNALIKKATELTPHDRFIVIQDQAEIQCTALNVEHLFTSHTRNLNDLVRETLRMRPDRIIIGEVRGEEALNLLEIWGTGHGGGFATAHSDIADPLMGLARIELLVSKAKSSLSDEFIKKLVASTVNTVVCIQEHENRRKIRSIAHVKSYTNNIYLISETKEEEYE